MCLYCFVKRYKQNALKLSQLFHDQPVKPLDKAIYWIEYVIRHKGAHHLKTAGDQLNWIQFLSIDVIVVLLCLLIITFIISLNILKKILKVCVNRKKSNVDQNKEDNEKKDK